MTLIQKLINLQIPNLEITHILDSKFEHQFELRTKDSGIIAIGWITVETEGETNYELSNKCHKINRDNYSLSKGETFYLPKWDGILFAINDSSLWSCDSNSITHYGKKLDSLENLIEQLKNKFDELKSQEEILQERNSNLKASNIEHEEIIKNLQTELEAAQSEIKKLSESNILLKENGNKNFNEIKSLKDGNTKLMEAIKSITNKRKNIIVSNLTKKQINAIISLSNDYYFYIGPTKLSQPIELNDELVKPDLLVKIRDEKIISYENEYDKIPVPTWRYFTISRIGKTTPISISTLLELPDATFIEGVLYIDDLIGCTEISTSDFDN